MTKHDSPLGRELARVGKLRKIRVYERGYILKTIGGDAQGRWEHVNRVSFEWKHETINFLNHFHTITLTIHASSGAHHITIRPWSWPIDWKTDQIGKVLRAIQSCGVEIDNLSPAQYDQFDSY